MAECIDDRDLIIQGELFAYKTNAEIEIYFR